jgi:hypothetical protein
MTVGGRLHESEDLLEERHMSSGLSGSDNGASEVVNVPTAQPFVPAVWRQVVEEEVWGKKIWIR